MMSSTSGKQKAFMYQSDYLKQTGETIPVVGIQFPSAGDPELVVKLAEEN